MIVPTAAEEQGVSDEVVAEQENLESDAEVTTDVAEESEQVQKEDEAEGTEQEAVEVQESQDAQEVQEKQSKLAEETVSVQTAKSANSFEIEGTVLKKYTAGTGGAVTIPDSVTEIDYAAFEGQEGITSVKFGKNLEMVGYSAFENCTNLKSVTWNSKVKTIDTQAFYGSGITSIKIPASVTQLNDYAFGSCKNLTDVVFEADVNLSYKLFLDCENLKNVTIAGKPSAIEGYALSGTDITTIDIPDSVKDIEMAAFAYCDSLTTLHLPDSITRLQASIIFSCPNLTSLYIPRYVSDCADNAVGVNSCPKLTVYIHPETTVAIEWAKNNNIRYEIIDESKPYAVESLKAAAYGKNKARLSWDKVENADGYLIYGKHGSDGKYGYIGMTTKNNYYIDKNALDTDYNFYWVYPYKLDDAGKRVVNTSCKYVYAKGICAAVTNLKASNQKGSVKLTWTKSNDAEGYLVYGKTESGKYGYIGMTSKTSYTDKKASKSEYNFYWVYPYYKNADGKMVVGQTGKYVYGKAK